MIDSSPTQFLQRFFLDRPLTTGLKIAGIFALGYLAYRIIQINERFKRYKERAINLKSTS